MKHTHSRIFLAFALNFLFSLFEFFGGLFTGSVAIISDAVHDFGDAVSIGLSYFLERRSTKKPDHKYTYGYGRYSVLGAAITNTVLFAGSCVVVYSAILRILSPVPIHYNGMILFALFGAGTNFLAAFFTRGGESMNQKAVNLHMMEDLLGWIVVFIGAVLMKFTNISIIDSLMSIGVALFILFRAMRAMGKILGLFLEKCPESVQVDEVKAQLLKITGVKDVHHIHIWSIDDQNLCATMHVVADVKDTAAFKGKVKDELKCHGIGHATLELESIWEHCPDKVCHTDAPRISHCHHHHH